VNKESATEQLQLVLPQILVLDVAVPDVGKSFLSGSVLTDPLVEPLAIVAGMGMFPPTALPTQSHSFLHFKNTSGH
jgi:hypothetical protein